ncbi:MAG: hypothetical protein IJT34_08250 [Butyrivibrio sp.]|nr:hypothetical protein [Butyrivibrio sp.]
MGINVNMDYSTLFSSLNGNSSTNYLSGLSNLVSDMNSIQNGSYSKLVGAYYSKLEKEGRTTSPNKKEASGKTSERLQNSRTYNTIRGDANSLQQTAEDFVAGGSDSMFVKKADGSYDESKITSAAADLVKKYNSLVRDGASAGDSTTSDRMAALNKISESYTKKLSSIGINYDEEAGTLSLNKDKMASAGMDKVKSVLGGRTGYAYQVSSAASRVETAAKNAAASGTGYNAKASTAAANAGYSSILDSYI